MLLHTRVHDYVCVARELFVRVCFHASPASLLILMSLSQLSAGMAGMLLSSLFNFYLSCLSDRCGLASCGRVSFPPYLATRSSEGLQINKTRGQEGRGREKEEDIA